MRQFQIITFAFAYLAVALAKTQVPHPPPPQPSGKQHTKTPTCPQGYYFQDGKCVTKQEVPEAHTCPAGTTERHGQCLQHAPARFTCDGGLALSGEECTGEEFAEKMHQCPSGATPIGKECIVHISTVPVCPAGTAALGERCAKLVPMIKGCPSGFTSRGDLCAAQEYEQSLSVCPNGTYQEGDVCKVAFHETEECPEGTVDVGQRCATYTHKISECPKGYSRAGHNCIRTESVQKTIYCPNGADVNNNCLVKVPVPPSPVCKVGKLVNGQCYKPKRTPPSFTCPSGYTLERGSTCIKVVNFDCSETHHDIECDQVPTGKAAANIRHRMLGVDAKGKYQTVNYSKRQPASVPLPVCHKVPRTTPKQCEKTITAQAEHVCPAGSVYKGSFCESDEYFAPEYVCDAQTDGKGSCYVDESTAVIRSCPAGFTNRGASCTRTETVAPSFFCPPGTEEPACATYVPKVCPRGGDCSNEHIEPPQVMCPDGYHMLQRVTQYHHGSTPTAPCTKTVYADKVASCPAGSVQVSAGDMTCATFVDKVQKSKDKRVAMQHLCPEGYAENQQRCARRVVRIAQIICPDDTQLDGNSCAKVVPQNSGCPKGAVADKGKCWAFSTVEPYMVDTVIGGHGQGGKKQY
eukprot:Selendium_serpulae@DN6006_c0_g1_i2.p1